MSFLRIWQYTTLFYSKTTLELLKDFHIFRSLNTYLLNPCFNNPRNNGAWPCPVLVLNGPGSSLTYLDLWFIFNCASLQHGLVIKLLQPGFQRNPETHLMGFFLALPQTLKKKRIRESLSQKQFLPAFHLRYFPIRRTCNGNS